MLHVLQLNTGLTLETSAQMACIELNVLQSCSHWYSVKHAS